MTDRQNAKLTMYQNVVDVCSECEQEYAGIPACVNIVSEFKQLIKDIQSATQQQQTVCSPKGATKDKSSAIDRLVELSLRVANPLYVFAFNIGNNRLMEKVNANKSMFYNVHDQTALILAKIIAGEAKACGEALTDYDINTMLLKS
jgi:hypothetical protein